MLRCLAIVLLVGILAAAQQPNPPICIAGSCSECLINAGCGWCAPTQTCHPGDFGGPGDGSLCLSGWFANLPGQPPSPEQCPACSAIPSCVQCTHTTGCGWCSNTSKCVEVTGTAGNCTPVGTCPCQDYTQCYQCIAQPSCTYCSKTLHCDNAGTTSCNGGPQTHTCECKQFSECNSCTSQETCAWCSGPRVCQDADVPSTCKTTTTCSPPSRKSSFSGGSFVGGIFLAVGVFVLVIGGAYPGRDFHRMTTISIFPLDHVHG